MAVTMLPAVHRLRRKVTASSFNYSDRRWTNASRRHRREEPLCRECKAEGKVTQARVTDHIVPISQGADPWDESNWQSLCTPHHDLKRKRESLFDMQGMRG